MLFLVQVSFFIALLNFCSSDNSPPLVNTSLGKIKGHYKTSQANVKYEAYEGVPYAEPPLRDNRFRPPTPVKPWQGVITANARRGWCWVYDYHIKSRPPVYAGDEDCLYLNVYVPVTRPSNRKLPIIVYIHGGGFQFSTLKGYEHNNFMSRDVIFVTLEYRVGVFGFLSTEDDVVSGNMGLKDQAVALKWIKEHIGSFGGDSSRITIVGESAGGASVHYHYLSPMSKGLFHAGISLSGTALMPWTQAKNSREKAFKLAELVNCETTNIQNMIQCLKSKPPRTLLEAQAKFMGWQETDFSPFGPVVEKITKGAFINRSPIEIIKSGGAQKLPWITSMTSEEGLFPVAEFCTNNTLMKELDKNWESIAPRLLQYYYSIPKSKHSEVARVVRQYYLGDKSINKENLLNLTHMVGDRIFGTDSVKAAKLQAKANNSPVWYYYFTYRPDYSLSELLSGSKENFGASHADDILLVYHEFDLTKKLTEKERMDIIMQKKLIDLWVTVAYNGQPGFKWPQLSPYDADFEYLKIGGPRSLQLVINNRLSHNQFWDSIGFNENVI